MAANRSRTERWRDCLQQIHEREGGLEISIPALPQQVAKQDSVPEVITQRAGDLIWRVRVLTITPSEIWVELPSAAGATIELDAGLGVVAVMSIGQNRWMFRTRTLGYAGSQFHGRPTKALRLEMPTDVERCQRRNFYRVSAASLNLPSVEVWPVLDPTSVVAAEVANRAQILDRIDQARGAAVYVPEEPIVLPDVGPKFTAKLMNIGGGGAGLLVDPRDTGRMDRAAYFWLRTDLTPAIPAPIAMTARLAHTHIDSTQNLYAGMAFEWSFNAGHKDFVVDQIRRYVRAITKAQLDKARLAA